MSIKSQITKIFTKRDELSFKNIRAENWAAICVFPLSFVISNMRHFDIETSLWGLTSSQLINFSLGFGWLVMFFLPKKLILPMFRLSVFLCAMILPFQLFLMEGLPLLTSFVAFQFFIGISIGASFYIFCFTLNNSERLFGMFFIFFSFSLLYYGILNIPFFADSKKTWGIILAMIAFFVILFRYFRKKDDFAESSFFKTDENDAILSDHFDFPVFLIILLVLVNHVMFMFMNDLAIAGRMDAFSMGIGMPLAIILIVVLQFYINRNTLYSWLLALVFSFLGISLLLLDSSIARYFGSFFYGFGNGIGMIITLFMCGGAINVHKSLKMYRMFCFMFFIIYVIISGIFFTLVYPRIDLPQNQMAFSIILALCCICFVMIPYLQEKFINSPWSEGAKLSDMIEYAPAIAETDQMDETAKLGLSPREKEIFILLLGDSQRKHIADTLKIGNGTVNFHVNNLYKKLGIQSRVELFAKYGKNR
jgi:DNA-binding CsgD family transcriptional regulator